LIPPEALHYTSAEKGGSRLLTFKAAIFLLGLETYIRKER